jgi:Bacteriophage T4 gp5 C-terminal trimerisation domain
MVSGMRSETYPRPKAAPPQARLGGGPVLPAAPAGGGIAPGGLGTEPAAAPAPSPAASAPQTPMPGVNGGPPAPFHELNAAVEHIGSKGPDLMDHHRSANAIVVDDTHHGEQMYLQAQKDFHETVKENLFGSVGRNRAFTILGNDTTLVQLFQTTEVGVDRRVEVGGKQTHFVQGNISVVTQANLGTEAKLAQAYTAGTLFVLRVGQGDGPGATILMTPTAIAIDAPKTYLNPGATFMNVLLQTGDSEAAATASKAEQNRLTEIASLEQQLYWMRQSDFYKGTREPLEERLAILKAEQGERDPET